MQTGGHAMAPLSEALKRVTVAEDNTDRNAPHEQSPCTSCGVQRGKLARLTMRQAKARRRGPRGQSVRRVSQ